MLRATGSGTPRACAARGSAPLAQRSIMGDEHDPDYNQSISPEKSTDHLAAGILIDDRRVKTVGILIDDRRVKTVGAPRRSGSNIRTHLTRRTRASRESTTARRM